VIIVIGMVSDADKTVLSIKIIWKPVCMEIQHVK
jgi:hypothetical protein